MAEIKENHPSWFKLKLERRKLIAELPPECAVKILLACYDYLETEVLTDDLTELEKIAVASFVPDVEEAWKRYEQRIASSRKGGAPKGNKNAKK